MERSLVWSALAIGFACWLAAFALTRTKRFALAGINAAIPPLFLAIAAGLPVLLFVITAPSHGRFFAPGHDLGSGFLLGAIGSLLSSILLIQSLRADDGEQSHLRIAAVTASPFGLGVACTAVPLLVWHDTLYIALLGVAIGWLAIAGVLLLGLMHGRNPRRLNGPEPITMLAGASFVALLCATVALGDFHGAVTFIKTSTSLSWGVLALATATAIPLFMLLSAASDLIFNPEPDSREKVKLKPNTTPRYSGNALLRAQTGRAVIAIAGVGALGRMLSNRVVDSADDVPVPVSVGKFAHLIELVVGPSHLFHVFSIGLLVGVLVWWISVTVQNREDLNFESSPTASSSEVPTPMPPYTWQNSALGILVVLAGSMAAFQMLAGFGVGLMVIGMTPAVLLALLSAYDRAAEVKAEVTIASTIGAGPAVRVVQLAAMGAILALFRVYTTVNEGLFPHSPYTDQYAAFGFVAGAVLPLFFTGYLMPKPIEGASKMGPSLVRLLVSGALLLAVPSLVLVLWGQKCTMAFLTALAIAAAGIASVQSSNSPCAGIRKLFPSIYAIGLALAMCEWSHFVLDMEDWTRVQKERVIVQIVGAVILLVVAADYGPRIAEWKQGRSRTALTSNSGGKGAAQ